MLIIELEKRITIKLAGNGEASAYFFFNICNSRGRVLTTSEMYTRKHSAIRTINSFDRGGLKFKLADNTL